MTYYDIYISHLHFTLSNVKGEISTKENAPYMYIECFQQRMNIAEGMQRRCTGLLVTKDLIRCQLANFKQHSLRVLPRRIAW